MNPGINLVLRIVLLIWVLGYLLVACGPLIGGHLIVGGLTFLLGVAFFVPWLLVTVILAVLVWATNPTRIR